MAIIEMQLPKYEVKLPISKVKVEFRPFTVKEEKILLIAQEEENVEAITNSIGQIISNCTFGKHTIDSLNKIDAEYLFIKIRSKSMGEGVEIRAICKSCEHKTPMTLNLDKIVVTNTDKKFEPILIMDNVWVTLKYPSIRESLMITDSNDGILALAVALDTIIEGENVKQAADYTLQERMDFIESMSNVQLQLFKKYLDEFPTMFLDVKYKCKCGTENEIHIEGVEHFFA